MNLELTLHTAARFTGLIGALAGVAAASSAGPAAAAAVARIANMGQAYLLMGARGVGRFARLNQVVQEMVDNKSNPALADLEGMFDAIEEAEILFLGWVPRTNSTPQNPA